MAQRRVRNVRLKKGQALYLLQTETGELARVVYTGYRDGKAQFLTDLPEGMELGKSEEVVDGVTKGG